jgi:hypothetical protein
MAAQHQAAQANPPIKSFIRHSDFQFLPEIPSPVIPEAAPEQNPAPVQEIRHEVPICV